MQLPPDIVAACVGRKARNELDAEWSQKLSKRLRLKRSVRTRVTPDYFSLSFHIKVKRKKRFLVMIRIYDDEVHYDQFVETYDDYYDIYVREKWVSGGFCSVSACCILQQWYQEPAGAEYHHYDIPDHRS